MGIIRLFLALVVVADHLNIFVLHPAGLLFNGYLKLGLSGPSAVMFFFVISGFLISYALSRKYAPGTKGTVAFYRSRFVRIFSVYWPLFALMVLFDFWGARDVLSTPRSLACGVALIGSDWMVAFNAYPADYWGCFPHALAPAWTLGAELTFYCLAPFLLRNSRAAISLFFISVIIRVTLLMTVGESNTWTYYFLPATFSFFLLGHFARLAYDRWQVPTAASWLLLALSCRLSLPSALNVSWETIHFYAAILCFAAALPGVFAATRSSRVLTWIGDMSFPLYLIHMTIVHSLFDPSTPLGQLGETLIRFASNLNDPVHGGELVTAITAAVCIAAATVVHYAIERPCAGLLFASFNLTRRKPVERRV